MVTQGNGVVVLKYQISLSKSTGSDIQTLDPLNDNSASSSESNMNINAWYAQQHNSWITAINSEMNLIQVTTVDPDLI